MKKLLTAFLILVGCSAFGQSVQRNVFTTNAAPIAPQSNGGFGGNIANLIPAGAVYTTNNSTFNAAIEGTITCYPITLAANTTYYFNDPETQDGGGISITDITFGNYLTGAGSYSTGSETQFYIYDPNYSGNPGSTTNGSPVLSSVTQTNIVSINYPPLNLNTFSGNLMGNSSGVYTPQPSNPNFGHIAISNGIFGFVGDNFTGVSGNGMFCNINHGDSVSGNGTEIQWQFNQMFFGPQPDGGHVQFGLGSQNNVLFYMQHANGSGSTSNGISHLLGLENQYTNANGILTEIWKIRCTNYDSVSGNMYLDFYANTNASAGNNAVTVMGSQILRLDSAGGIITTGIGSTATNSVTISNTGYTNATHWSVRIFNLVGTSLVFSNQISGLNFSLGSPSNSGIFVLLGKNDCILGSVVSYAGAVAY